MLKSQRMDLTTPIDHIFIADDLFHWPVTAFDEVIRLALLNESKWRRFTKCGDSRHGFQRGDNRHAIFQWVEWAVAAFIQTAYRFIAVDRDNQRRAQLGGVLQIADVAQVQDVETAIGKDQRPGS